MLFWLAHLDLCNSNGVKFCWSFFLPHLSSNEADRSSFYSASRPRHSLVRSLPTSHLIPTPNLYSSFLQISRRHRTRPLHPLSFARSPHGVHRDYLASIRQTSSRCYSCYSWSRSFRWSWRCEVKGWVGGGEFGPGRVGEGEAGWGFREVLCALVSPSPGRCRELR